MRYWLVVTPEYEVPVIEAGQSIAWWEPHCDTIYVAADTKKRAIVVGVREMRRRGSAYYRSHLEGRHPFSGVIAEEVEEAEFLSDTSAAEVGVSA